MDYKIPLVSDFVVRHPQPVAWLLTALMLVLLIFVIWHVAVVHFGYGKAQFTAAPAAACSAGQRPITDSAGRVVYCAPGAAMSASTACSGAWDPSAALEAEALAAVGAFEPTNAEAERLLAVHTAGAILPPA